jgi:hypothetical protein
MCLSPHITPGKCTLQETKETLRSRGSAFLAEQLQMSVMSENKYGGEVVSQFGLDVVRSSSFSYKARPSGY